MYSMCCIPPQWCIYHLTVFCLTFLPLPLTTLNNSYLLCYVQAACPGASLPVSLCPRLWTGMISDRLEYIERYIYHWVHYKQIF